MFWSLKCPAIPVISYKDNEIFYLDWSGKEERTKENFINWFEHHYSKSFTETYLEIIPKPYDNWIKNFNFKLNQDCIKEINDQLLMGFSEWNNQNFNSPFNEYCLKGAIQHFENVFYILSNCIIDNKGNEYKKYQQLALSVMLYKFWEGQTNMEFLKDFALISKLDTKDVFVSQYVYEVGQNYKQIENLYYSDVNKK